MAERGAAVTTAQIAHAAGIGEATIFRVFDDKDAVLEACVAAAMDPTQRHARVAESEIRQAARSQGAGDLSELAAVVLESDGSLSVIPRNKLGDASSLDDVLDHAG